MPEFETARAIDDPRLREYVLQLEQRIARLESHLGMTPLEPAEAPSPASVTASRAAEETQFELRFGEYGLSWIGSIILLLGIIFLMAYTFNFGYKLLASVVGYFASVSLFLIARRWRQSIPHVSRLMLTSSLLLLYYTTMTLHFYSQRPLVQNVYVGLGVLLLVVAAELAFAVERASQPLTALVLALGVFAALLSDGTHLLLVLLTIHAAIAASLARRREWWTVLNATIPFVYLAHLIWLINNPVAGNPAQPVTDQPYNLAYLFLYGAIFSAPVLSATSDGSARAPWLGTILLNAAGFSAATSVAAFALRDSYGAIYLTAGMGCLIFSVVLWKRWHKELAPALYACCGYLALSIAIYAYAGIPAAFLWFSLQSLLVVCMALWFRSRVLVVANSGIYLCMLLAYLFGTKSSNLVNFSFAIVALATARVMNWKKERLTLRTNMLRNVYLFLAFFLVLYSLYEAVPSHYVTLTWTAAAVGYFALSVWLHNVKYRWMAIFTMLMTISYLFVVDLARLDAIYRVAAFLVLGLITLVISLFYTKYKRLLGRTGN